MAEVEKEGWGEETMLNFVTEGDRSIGSHCNKDRSHSNPWLDRRKEKNGRCQNRSGVLSSSSWFFFFVVDVVLKNLLQILFSSKRAGDFCQDCSNYSFFCSQLFFNSLTGIYWIPKHSFIIIMGYEKQKQAQGTKCLRFKCKKLCFGLKLQFWMTSLVDAPMD